jgi:hypothetical protein
MALDFLRLPTDYDAPDYRLRLATYMDYIDSLDHESEPDLFAFFVWTPFHDGPIEDIAIGADGNSLSFRVMHPDIRRHHSQESTFAWFRCQFNGVPWCQLSVVASDVGIKPAPQPLECTFGEINGLAEQIKCHSPAFKRPLYSLLLQLRPRRPPGPERLLGIVFERLQVIPENEERWREIRAGGDWDLSLYTRGNRLF